MLLNIFTTAIFLFFACVILLSEEKIRHHNCRNSPCKVGEQCVTRSIARLHHAHTAEIDCEDIERGVGGAPDGSGHTTHKCVGTILFHDIEHH